MWGREGGRRLLPCPLRSEDRLGSRRSLDEKFGAGRRRDARSPPSTWRRQSERIVTRRGGSREASCRRRQGSKEEREKTEEEGVKESRKRRKEGEEVKRQRREGEKEGGRQRFHVKFKQRDNRKECSKEGFVRRFREDRLGSFSQSEDEAEEESSEVTEKKQEEEKGFVGRKLRGIQFQHGKWEPSLPGKQESKSDRLKDAWGPHCPIRGRDAGELVDRIGTGVEHAGRSCSTSSSSLLSQCSSTEDDRRHSKGSSYTIHPCGHGVAREDRGKRRHSDPEIEVSGVSLPGIGLSNHPEDGAMSFGIGHDGLLSREEGGHSRKPRGVQASISEWERRRLLEGRMERRLQGLGQEGRREEGKEGIRKGRRQRERIRRRREEKVRETQSFSEDDDAMDGRAWTPSPWKMRSMPGLWTLLLRRE